jgi:tetratricopeptide (TPR) repeat protein
MTPASFSQANEETYESLISLIENSQGRLAPIIVACDDWALRQQVIDRYESEAQEARILPFRVVLGQEPSVRAALAKLKEENESLQQNRQAVFTVTGAETLLRVTLKSEDDQSELDKFFGYLQWTREGLREFRYPIVLWITYRILKEISRRAPDFWSWRKAVLRFETETEDVIPTAAPPLFQLNQTELQHSDLSLPPLEELQAEIQQLESTSPNSAGLATLYEKLGQVYADRVRSGEAADLDRERQEAIAAFQTAIQQYQQHDRKFAQGAALTKLGIFLRSQSKFSDAIELYQQSLEIAREIGNQQGEAASLGNLGNVYSSLGQYQRAVELHQQHLEIAREIGDRQQKFTPLINLGISYNLSGQYQQAIDPLQQHLEIAREIGDQPGEALSLIHLANSYNLSGQYQQAINLYQHWLEISRKDGDLQGEAYGLNNLSTAYISLGQYQEGLEKLQQAKKLFAAIGLDDMVQLCDETINEINQIVEEE